LDSINDGGPADPGLFPCACPRGFILPGGEMHEDKRKFRRFKAREGAFAAFIRPNELVNMGQIQDISAGGLCVRYLATDNSNDEWSAIKIFGCRDRFLHLDRVKCRIVYNHEVPEGSWEQISTRKCGVEFNDLSVKHQSILEEFIGCFASADSKVEILRV